MSLGVSVLKFHQLEVLSLFDFVRDEFGEICDQDKKKIGTWDDGRRVG